MWDTDQEGEGGMKLTGTGDQQLEQWLRLMVAFRRDNDFGFDRRGYEYSCMEDFILRHGQPFDVANFAYVAGTPRACYGNSLRAAANNHWDYVEGVATTGVLPVHHAWCVRADGTPVETTWDAPDDADARAYRGVVIPFGMVREALAATGSVLDDWQRDWPILKGAWPC